MPRNVRNFWIDGTIDGRSSGLSGGPQGKDGGFSMTILQREDGAVADGMRVTGGSFNGRNVLRADVDDACIEVVTHRDKPGRKIVVHVGSETYSIMNTLDAEVVA